MMTMTKEKNCMSLLNDKMVEVVNQLITDLNTITILKGERENLIKNISKEINSSKVNMFFNQAVDINVFDDDEQRILIKHLHKYSNELELSEPSENKQVFSNDVYNKEFKLEFLDYSGYSSATKRVVILNFEKISSVEKEFDKNVYEFNNEEIEHLLRAFRAKTVRSLQNIISKINKYIQYAQKCGKTDKNIIKNYTGRKVLDEYLDGYASENMILNRETVMEIADVADNPQDGVILGLIFDGVNFTNEFEELVNLEKNMVDEDNEVIHLPARTDGDVLIEARDVPISRETQKLINRAITIDEYYSITGNNSRKYKLQESDYVLRGFRKGREKINWRNINQRILRLSEMYDEEFLTATNISYSGQLYHANEMIKKGVSIQDTVTKILKRFGMPINQNSEFYLKKRIEKYLDL